MHKPRRESSLKALQAIKESSIIGKYKSKPCGIENQLLGIKRKHSPSPIKYESIFGKKRNPLENIVNKDLECARISEDLRRSDRIKQQDNIKRFSNDSLQDTSTKAQLCTSSNKTSQLVCYETPNGSWNNIDQADMNDPLFSSEYAPDIFSYMRKREELFIISPYLKIQPHITASMRTILVDWLVEVQENFELFHETLYLAVKILDRYLTVAEVKKEYLQLVGATAMLVAAKFEELSPPLVDDFIYLCDDAYTHEELLVMEQSILSALNYDINMPIAYRFIRRLARAADVTMETHTLARYISESTLQEYEFIDVKPSLLAAASMYLALRLKKLGTWNCTMEHYSGYCVTEMVPLVKKLNHLISKDSPTTCTVKSKYSHEVFFQVALINPLIDVNYDISSDNND